MRVLVACVGSWLALSLFTWTGLGFSWSVPLSCALSVAVLYVVAAASNARGWPLFWILSALYGGIGIVNIQFESLAFKVGAPAEIIRDTAIGLAEVVGVSAMLAFAVTRQSPDRARTPHRLAGWLWLRVSVVALSYVVLYLVAGSLIFPLVRYFYASTDLVTIPPIGVVLGTQFLRGLIYVGAMVPLLGRMAGRRPQAAWLAGLSLSVFGGIAPLLLPVDDVLPPAVRGVHMLEIFVSNFMLGVIAAYLLVRRAAFFDSKRGEASGQAEIPDDWRCSARS